MTVSTLQLDVGRIVAACGCREGHALILLKRCGGDADKAIDIYQTTQGFCRGIGKHCEDKKTQPSDKAESSDTSDVAHDTSEEEGGGEKEGGEEKEEEKEEDSQSTSSDQTPEPPVEIHDWDFVLPRVPAPQCLINGGVDGSNGFFLEELVGAIQAGESATRIRNYLAFYNHEEKGIGHLINKDVKGFPAFFYVVETRDPDLVRAWAKYGGDINCHACANKVPLLAYAIAIGDSYEHDTRLVVAALLSLGADMRCIPEAYFVPLSRDLPEDSLEADRDSEVARDPDHKSWLTAFAAGKVIKALNFAFTSRSHLHLAAILEQRSGAERQVARIRNSSDLLAIPFSLIGQVPASICLIDRFLAYLAMPSKKPVVFVFAGPSGHGKTEISQQLGHLLSLDFLTVDCTSINNETDIFGPRAPYKGSEAGSALNNFVAAHNGQRCVVFLDEFEKTDNAVRQTFLIPFQNGTYQDRRNLSSIDCSKTIWIIATNAFDDLIHDFCRKNRPVLVDAGRLNDSVKLVKKLSNDVRKESIGKFGAPLTGRITQFIPFLTFSPCEAACVVDKYLAEFGREVQQHIRLTNNENIDRMVGDVLVRIRRGYRVCKAVADVGYVEELGARSVICEVDAQIKFPTIDAYLKSLGEIREGQGRSEYVVDVSEDGEIEVTYVPRVKEAENDGEED